MAVGCLNELGNSTSFLQEDFNANVRSHSAG